MTTMTDREQAKLDDISSMVDEMQVFSDTHVSLADLADLAESLATASAQFSAMLAERARIAGEAAR